MAEKPTYEELEQRIKELEKETAELKQEVPSRKAHEDLESLDEQLKKKHAELEVIFKAIPDAVVFADLNRNITKINPGFTRLFGYEPEEIYEKKTKVLFTKEEKFKKQGEIRHNPDAREMYQPYEIDYRKKNGDIFHSETVGTPVRNEQGEAIGLLAIVRDITDRKLAEEKLRESERQVRLLLDSTAEAIYGLDLEGRCTFANPACAKLLGYESVDEFLGKKMHELIHHTHSDGSPYPEEECRACQAFRAGKLIHVDDEVLWRSDGTSFPVEYRSYPIREDDKVIGAVFTFLDITEQKRLEEERRKIEGQLRQLQKMEAIGTLASGIAHDFNNILASILGYTELAIDKVKETDHNILDYLEIVQQSGHRAKDLVHQILQFSRSTDISFKPIEIQLIIKEALKLLRASLPATIEIRQKIQPVTEKVMADGSQIHQVVMNLCIQFLPHDHKTRHTLYNQILHNKPTYHHHQFQ